MDIFIVIVVIYMYSFIHLFIDYNLSHECKVKNEIR